MIRSAVHRLQRGFKSSLGNLEKPHVSVKGKKTVENTAQWLNACLIYPKPQFGVKKAVTGRVVSCKALSGFIMLVNVA